MSSPQTKNIFEMSTLYSKSKPSSSAADVILKESTGLLTRLKLIQIKCSVKIVDRPEKHCKVADAMSKLSQKISKKE